MEYYGNTKGPTDLEDALLKIKAKCDRLGTAYPTYVCVDDCCQCERTIHKVFPLAKVGQDIKHLINRMVGQLNKTSEAYGIACQELHNAITGGKMWVRSRTGKLCEIDAPLPAPATMLAQLDRCIANLRQVDVNHNLFKADFDKTVTTQKDHIRKGCVSDPSLNGVHYAETTDGKFTMLRGTNRNESIHRRLNAIWPDRCGPTLAAAILSVFFFDWTAARIGRPLDSNNGRSSTSSSSNNNNSSSTSSGGNGSDRYVIYCTDNSGLVLLVVILNYF